MRTPSAIRLLSAVLLYSWAQAFIFGQSTPIEPFKVKICDLVREPARFAGDLVQVQSEFVSRFQWEGFVDDSCSAKIQVGVFHVLDDLKPEQGEYAFTKLNDDNTHPGRLGWKPIQPPLPIHLKLDDNYRRFRRYADEKFKWPMAAFAKTVLHIGLK